jgi:hypothetical protein
MGEEYGYDAIEAIVLDVAKFGMKFSEARSEDSAGGKKITAAEYIVLAVFAAPKAFEHVGNANVIKQQLKDLDQVERGKILARAAEVFDLANDVVEEVIENWLDVLSSFDKAITATLALKE